MCINMLRAVLEKLCLFSFQYFVVMLVLLVFSLILTVLVIVGSEMVSLRLKRIDSDYIR